MPQVRRALISLVSVLAVVLGFAPGAFAQSPTSAVSAGSRSAPRVAVPAAHAASAAPVGAGYWLADAAGGVVTGGSATAHGTLSGGLTRPVVGIASTPSRHGYWMVASDGGIFSFGDAAFHGSTGAMTLNKPIVGMASTPSGHGYWLVASDGGIFAFGDAGFHGSTGAMTLNQPIVGISSSPSGHGYWMVASDGGVFSFGDSTFHGSTGAIVLNKPIVGLAATPTGHGYWFVASDGGVFSFGDAHFFGSGTADTNAPFVGIAPSAPVPATKLMFSTQPGDAAAGSELSTQPVVTIQNAGGTTVTADTSQVTLALTNAAGATLGCTSNPVTAVAGVATFAGCTINQPGTYTLTATDGTLAEAVSDSVTIAVAAVRLSFTTEPSSTATGGTPFVVQPVVEVLDNLGNTVATDASTVTLTLTTANGATLTCAPDSNTQDAVSGVATFTGCSIDLHNVTPYTLTASDGGLIPAISTATTVAIGAASKLGFVQEPSATTASMVNFASQPHVAIQDAGGNTVATNGVAVTLSLTTAAGAVLTCTSTTVNTDVTGIATFAACHVDLANTYTLHAAAAGPLVGTSSALAITVGAPSKLGFVQQPSASTVSLVNFLAQPQVAVQDAGGNTVTGNTDTVVLSLTTPGGATLTCTSTSVAAVSGIASFAGCHIDKATNYTLHAADGGFVGTSGNVAITAAAATHLVFTTQPVGGVTSGTSFSVQPIVTVEDASGNTVTTNVTPITLTVTGALNGATVSCTTNPVTPSSGVASFLACHITTGTPATYTLTADNGALPTVVSGNVVIN